LYLGTRVLPQNKLRTKQKWFERKSLESEPEFDQSSSKLSERFKPVP
jgi:hypothetical protein